MRLKSFLKHSYLFSKTWEIYFTLLKENPCFWECSYLHLSRNSVNQNFSNKVTIAINILNLFYLLIFQIYLNSKS